MLKKCYVSLPEKATPLCKLRRSWELATMKTIWKLKVSPHRFALSDVPSLGLILLDLFIPYTRFYLEGYLQTVLVTKLGPIVLNGLVNKEGSPFDMDMYQFLSKFFEVSAEFEFGGVRVTFCLIVGLCSFVSLFICSSCYHYCHCHTAI